jgi:hypothetical protein
VTGQTLSKVEVSIDRLNLPWGWELEAIEALAGAAREWGGVGCVGCEDWKLVFD